MVKLRETDFFSRERDMNNWTNGWLNGSHSSVRWPKKTGNRWTMSGKKTVEAKYRAKGINRTAEILTGISDKEREISDSTTNKDK